MHQVISAPARAGNAFACENCGKALHAPASTGNAVIHAELIGSDTAIALGITVSAYAPVLELCRRLIEAGVDPATRLDAYRGQTLCLRVRSVGEAAGLEVNTKGTGFACLRSVSRASPVRKNLSGGPGPKAARVPGHARDAVRTGARGAP
jgi:hypothetical protein